ncbi:MAG: inosine/xanthosine triphosphatase, partial [Xanthomonadales bacterium]|nr:inosine/xanthosine triphosphatase [Xanthomonadales bacterium]
MKVIVTSKNPVKIRAVERAFSETLDPQVLDIVPVSVPSGVSDQPRSDTETRRGALNRVSAGQRVEPDADDWVGMEGGLERHDGEWLASAWMVISDRDG